MHTRMLLIGGIAIKVCVQDGGNEYYHSRLITLLEKQYGFFQVLNSPQPADFTIEIRKYDSVTLSVQKVSTTTEYFLTPIVQWNWKKKLAHVPFHISQAQLEVVIKTILMRSSQNILFLHASSVFTHGKVHIFLAPAGGGKSTFARYIAHHKDVRKTSDDLCLLTFHNENFSVFFHPFIETDWKYKRTSLGYPIGGIYSLHKGSNFQCSSESNSALAYEMLLHQTISRYDRFSPQELALITHLVKKVPLYSLTFALNRSKTINGFMKAIS